MPAQCILPLETYVALIFLILQIRTVGQQDMLEALMSFLGTLHHLEVDGSDGNASSNDLAAMAVSDRISRRRPRDEHDEEEHGGSKGAKQQRRDLM